MIATKSPRSLRSILRAALFLCVASAGAFGQEPDPQVPVASQAEVEVLLRDRNRASLHPGDPLALVGIEQGDNEMRSRTPALANSDRKVKNLNPDDNYARTLAMYDGGARFTQPGKAMPATRTKTSRSAWRRVIAPLDEQGNSARSSIAIRLFGLFTMLGGIAVLVWWRVKSGQTEEPAAA